MKIAIVGSRKFIDKEFVYFTVKDHLRGRCLTTAEHQFISGGAKGVDSWGEESAKQMHAKCIIFKPDWDKYGKSAGFIRNKLIINEADKVLAFWDGISKGTKHSIDLAIKAKKPINIYIRN